MANKVLIIATGGTIAGTGKSGESAGYVAGSLDAKDLLATIPQINSFVDIETIQVCNINSDDVNEAIWIDIANIINDRSKDADVLGFVITHGTDTLEETAYFLQLVVKTHKPVVLTGSIRPATAIAPEGPMNLYEAIMVAKSDKAIGRGVLVVFSNEIYSARFVSKANSSSVTAMSGGLAGAMGTVHDNHVYFYYNGQRLHTLDTEFDVKKLNDKKVISTIFFGALNNINLLKMAIDTSDGVVIAGAGLGEYSKDFIDIIANAKIPIVVSSRVPNGIIFKKSLLNKNTITSFDLSPQKAAILLRLALTISNNQEYIQELYKKY